MYIRQEHRLTAPRDPSYNPLGNGNTLQDAVVSTLVLQHHLLVLPQVEANLRIAKGARDRLDDGAKDGGQIQLASQRLAYLIQKGCFLSLALGSGQE